MRIESYQPGDFVWSELASSDPAASKQFYCDMFGWTYMDAQMPQGVYTIFRCEGEDAAAMYQAPAGMRSSWGVYFNAPELDTTTEKAKDLGATIIMPPTALGAPGNMSIVRDPQGAFLSLWKAKGNIGATYNGQYGRVVWPELGTPHPAASAAFYSALFGWKTKPESGFETGEYFEWVNHGVSLGGMMPMRGEMWKGIPPHWMIYVTVADCDERAAHAASLGAKLHVPPRDIPNTGRFSVIEDKYGAVFSIIQMTHQHAAA